MYLHLFCVYMYIAKFTPSYVSLGRYLIAPDHIQYTFFFFSDSESQKIAVSGSALDRIIALTIEQFWAYIWECHKR